MDDTIQKALVSFLLKADPVYVLIVFGLYVLLKFYDGFREDRSNRIIQRTLETLLGSFNNNLSQLTTKLDVMVTKLEMVITRRSNP